MIYFLAVIRVFFLDAADLVDVSIFLELSVNLIDIFFFYLFDRINKNKLFLTRSTIRINKKKISYIQFCNKTELISTQFSNWIERSFHRSPNGTLKYFEIIWIELFRSKLWFELNSILNSDIYILDLIIVLFVVYFKR
jgi:hypothetical protein